MKNTKVLSLVVVLVFALSMMLTACGTTEVTPSATATPAATPTPAAATPTPAPVDTTVAKPERIDITLTGYFGDSLDNTESKKNYMDWMTEQYGINFKIHYPARNNYTEVINLAVAAQDLDGLVGLFTPQENREWMTNGLIYPLTDFLADNDTYNNIFPESWKETYTFDGELWGIARGDDGNPSMFTRSIRGDWLAALGLQRPTTVWELYEASYQFTYNDPDGNGIDDTYGMTSRTTWLMQDLFQAFDARLNHVGDAQPIWNPNTNTWEDSMIKPEMVECLELLQKMATENVMDKEAFVHSSSVARGKVQSGYYGGLFYWDSWTQSFESSVKQNFPDGWMDGIYALKGNITVNINQYGIGQGAPYAMTVTTPEPKETINWYMDIFFGTAAGLFQGKYGIQGDFIGEGMFTLSGNKVYINYFMKDSKVTGWGSPSIAGGHPDYAVGLVYEVIYNSPDLAWNESTTLRVNSGLQQRKAWFDEALAWGGIYILPESLKEPTSDKYLQISSDISAASQEAISKSMISEVSVADALAKYRQTAKTLGVKEVLDLANAEIGATTSQTY
jgi:ABC-type glycerol-3-phosphate transport system substrate-binding protein